MNFTWVVDDFGMKYSRKYHAVHLKSALEDKYKVTSDWEGKFYIGIALKSDYEKGTVKISMPDYVCAELHSFQHGKPQRHQESTYPFTQPIYEKNNPMLSEKAPAEKLDDNNKKRHQKIVGKFLYYDRALDPTMMMALNSLVAVHTNPKIKT